MMFRQRTRMSIQRRLLLSVFAVMAAGIAITGGVVYLQARDEANALFDMQLRQFAASLPVRAFGALAPQAPGVPEAGVVPFILAERIDYRDAAPWPLGADGTGASLQRRVPAGFRQLLFEFKTAGHIGRIFQQREIIWSLGRSEYAVEGIIILLRDRIVFMVVAPGAGDR